MGAKNLWETMPSTVPRAAAELRLGAGLLAHRTRTSRLSWWGAFMLLLVAAFSLKMIFIISDESEWTNAILFIILGGGSLLGALAVPLIALLRPVKWSAVFEQGVVHQDGKRPPIAGAWEEITSCFGGSTDVVRNGATMTTHHSLCVQLPAGTFWVTGDTPAALQMCDLIARGYNTVRQLITEEQTTARLAEVSEALQAGERLAFGPFAVSLAGLEHAGTLRTWESISEVELM